MGAENKTAQIADQYYRQRSKNIAYPSEYLIRIFKGVYPRLNLGIEGLERKTICDMGCGDGRNIFLFEELGMEACGVEISEELVNKAKANLKRTDYEAVVKIGTNDAIPFEDSSFDYFVSWNSGYYMTGGTSDFNDHLKEFNRVIRPGGRIVVSIPKKTNFIFDGYTPHSKGYVTISNDYFSIRNGVTFRMFKDQEEIEQSFLPYFFDFIWGSIEDDCFGLNYHWHLVVARKRE